MLFRSLKCTPSREQAAEEQFIATEREVSRNRVRNAINMHLFGHVGNVLFGRVLARVSDDINELALLPRHGPGSTEDRTIGNQKFVDRRTSVRLQRVFPDDWYEFFNHGEFADSLSDTSRLEKLEPIPRKDEPPVRVVFVPKTMKTPRVIAIEPVWNQKYQQALMKCIVRYIESDKLVGGHVNFARQEVNRNLAFESSISRSNATIDLSEASDRVDPALVSAIMQYHPTLCRMVFACRSERAKLPSGRVITLSKFASQGSALCFPVEAMVFYSIVVLALLKHRKLHANSRNIEIVAGDVYVYGDDIIVPSLEVQAVYEALEAAGLKVNRKKSFSSGFFRESCGMDAFMGVNVTPVYIRHPVPVSRRDAKEVESSIASSNLFYKKGYWKTAQALRDIVESAIGVVPHVPSTSAVSGWFSYRGRCDFHGWNDTLQKLRVRGPKLTARKISDPLDGYSALTKWSTCRSNETDIVGNPIPLDRDSFSHSVARGKLKLNFRWSPVN